MDISFIESISERINKLLLSDKYDGYYFLRMAIDNMYNPLPLLQKYVNDEDSEYRMLVASSLKCDKEIFEQLSNDIEEVKIVLAKNPNCPINILEKFVNSENKNVICAVVQNVNCPNYILERVYTYNDSYLNSFIVRNKNCSTFLLNKIAEEEEKSYIENKKDIQSSYLIELILSNANCSKELLTKYSKYDCFSHIVAKNPNCPLDILEELFIKNDPYDKKYIAMNPNCPLDILDKLADEEDVQIIVEVAKNSHTSSKTLDKLIDKILNSNFHYASIVYHIINNPNLSASSLKRLMDNGYKKEVASRSNISRDIIEKLMVDSNSIIREVINPMTLESEINDDGNHASLNYKNILHRNFLMDIEDIEYSILNIDCPISTSLFLANNDNETISFAALINLSNKCYIPYMSEEEYNEYKDTFVTDENIELVSLNRRNFSLKKGNQF